MDKKGRSKFVRVVGASAVIFVCSAFLIWAYDDGQPWFKTRRLHSSSASGSALFKEFSIIYSHETQEENHIAAANSQDHGVSWGKSAGARYMAKNQSIVDFGALLKPAVNGSNHVRSNKSTVDEYGQPFSVIRINASEAEEKKEVLQRPDRSIDTKHCDIFEGKWVYDESYALYLPGSCPYSSNDFNCRKNGRKDSQYERWRWQPRDCNVPRFNASHMLERLRGKRLVYVGDSINRNQWESMLCLLRAAVPEGGGKMKAGDGGKFIAYLIKAYNCSVELSWAPFLVQQRRIPATNDSAATEALRIDTIDEQSRHWKQADVLVFNTGHWWTHEEPYNGVNYFEEGRHVHAHMEEAIAFEKALRTWARWVETNINPHSTQVFFRGYSPVHFHGKAWGKRVGGGCFNETEPIDKMEEEKERIYGERKRMSIVEKVLGDTKIGVKLLNVTRLSMYRKDAHSSVYTSKYITMTNKNDYSIADCSHWCLPGLPDVWNNLLYALIM